ncbi:zinc metalloprotease HtpX [Inmirania thermothiophila]|uniref:Heat shock protein HtpX n=1 Tax=Inmirania thermothiophila TaxID=1750597 RepID=A0A3N1Y9T2_9GAMM|nr:zinc metalloprotease HtpX [Inmirania thermothiophila]ROR34157.1 heat shock protein HtpX [Inmirania thermothiophila]
MLDPQRLRLHRLRNLVHSALLLGGMALLAAALGWVLGGREGVVWTALSVLAVLLLGGQVSPLLVLRLYGARPLSPAEAPALYRILEILAARAGLPAVPTLHWVPSPVMNAFAVGRPEQAAVAVTDGLLARLTLREVAGVLAHEVSHIRHNDLWIMGLADVVSRLTSSLSFLGQLLVLLNLPVWLLTGGGLPWAALLLLVLAPTVSALLQLALSRTREYEADLGAVRLTGDPQGLASALAKLERYQRGWMERLFLPGRGLPDPSLLRTHPPTEERIRRILSVAARPVDWGLDPGTRPVLRLPAVAVRPPRWRIGGLWW